ncbi:MAG: Gfo/Idh/MocA family oxidoreductase [Planctomycetes bacterium]|nr:Gfo/Idh/MocA family oxidoreductase [Planctomycetota bacterium]
MKKEQKVTRRGFLKGTAAVAGAMVFPAIVPSSVFGQNAPSNRIVMGAIGTGSMGTGDLRGFLNKPEVQMVAVCDVDKNHRDEAKQIVDQRYRNNDCGAYNDFRELLGRGDLDAVQIAIPDHWHGIISVAAARTGVDIHGQKPLARTIREGRAICDAVKRYGIVWQTGSQQRSDSRFRQACELVRNERLGKIEKVEVGLPTGGTYPLQPLKPVPPGLDWDMWLGPAPWRPFCDFGNDGCHYQWRWIMDYSGGQMTDWAGHHIDIAGWGLDLDHTGPVEIEGTGVYPEDGLYNVPMRYHVECKYANGIPMIIANNSEIDQGVRWYGEKGWVFVKRGQIDADPKSLLDEVIGPDEIKLYVSRDHKQDFLNCVKSRREPIAPVEVGHRSISVALLGEIAMLTGRKIKWDPEKEEILNDPGASALLSRAFREPWVL